MPDLIGWLRARPDRVEQAYHEVLRLETPISGFTRFATRGAEIGGTDLPAGGRVLVSYSSANRDERRWDAPDIFDVSRDRSGSATAGMPTPTWALARLEAAAVLSAVALALPDPAAR